MTGSPSRAPAELPPALAPLAEDGLVVRVDGFPVVAGISEDPLLPDANAFVPWIDPRLTQDVGRVVEAVLAELGGLERIVVRLPPEVVTAAERAGLERLTRYIAKEPRPAAGPSPDWTVRPAEEGDRPFVHDLHVRALVDGYRSGGFAVPEEEARAYVERELPTFSTSGPVSAYVALDEDRLVGHATWIHEAPDDVTGEVFAELFDVFVLPEHRGRGIDRALLGAVETAAAPLGRRLLGHIVCEPDGRDATILEKLQAAGWEETYVLWHRRLPHSR